MKKTHLRKSLRSLGQKRLVELLIAQRIEAGMTQRDLAQALKRPRSLVGRMETGQRRIDVIEFCEIAEAFGVDPRRLFAKFLE